MNNLKQTGTGLWLYAGDYSGSWFPAAKNTSPAETLWPSVMGSYLNIPLTSGQVWNKTPGTVLDCPSAPGSVTAYGDYTMNARLANDDWNLVPIRLPPLTSSTEGFVVADMVTSITAWFLTSVGTTHSGGSNILFVDGHVEWRLESDVPADYNDTFWRGK